MGRSPPSRNVPLAAALMEGVARALPRAPGMFALIEHWPCDLASDGVIFRLNAGLHALAHRILELDEDDAELASVEIF